jgi:hypothetical protein
MKCAPEHEEVRMDNVVSVNVGLPKDVKWRGTLVRTAIWKQPVQGNVLTRRLNLSGDGQAGRSFRTWR